MEWTYAAGEFEQGRNVSLLTGNKITILDPRYSPTGGMKLYPTIRTDWLTANGIAFTERLPYEDDLVRDPSKFFMIYETGDNTTVAEGEAIPLDLFYSRATVYGDVWEVMDYYHRLRDDLLLDRWPWVENKQEILSGEAGMVANPGGTFMYIVWNQWEEEIIIDEFGVEHELIFNCRHALPPPLYLPDDAPTTVAAPVAEILAAPIAALATDQLTFIGTGLDADNPDGADRHRQLRLVLEHRWLHRLRPDPGEGWRPAEHRTARDHPGGDR